jgi:hypothetical protein
MRTSLIVVFVILLFSALSAPSQSPPLVDGNCSEYSALKATRLVVSKDVDLHIYQDQHFVWLCYTYPDGSFATADLKLTAPALTYAINLHVSAQLGEWPAGRSEFEPSSPESDLWWNQVGWTANTVWINGMDRSGATPKYRFKNAKAREFQLSKQRFGRGTWNFSIAIRSIKGADGNNYNVTFPTTGTHTLKVT